jgi:hypothetical protein
LSPREGTVIKDQKSGKSDLAIVTICNIAALALIVFLLCTICRIALAMSGAYAAAEQSAAMREACLKSANNRDNRPAGRLSC